MANPKFVSRQSHEIVNNDIACNSNDHDNAKCCSWHFRKKLTYIT